MIYVESKSWEDLFKKAFILLYESKVTPFIPDLYREERAVLLLDDPEVEPIISLPTQTATIDFDYDKIIDGGNERFEIEYWHYYYELIQSGKVDALIKHLKDNQFSKRGVIELWKGEYRDSKQPAPCLINMSFFIRKGKLDVNSHMRANDGYRIFLIDLHILRSVHKYVADQLNLDVGSYVHFVDTFHIYRKDSELAEKLYNNFKKS